MSFNDLPDVLLLIIACKLDNKGLCKFRRCNKKMDTLVEKNRFEIASSHQIRSLTIEIRKNGLKFFTTWRVPTLIKPFRQLSGFSFEEVTLDFKGKEPMNTKTEEKLTTLLQKLKLTCKNLHFGGRFAQKEISTFVHSICYENHLKIDCKNTLSASEILPSFQHCSKKLIIRAILTDFSAKDFCAYTRNFWTVGIYFKNDENTISIKAFEELIEEISRNQHLTTFPRVRFRHHMVDDVNHIFKGMPLIWRTQDHFRTYMYTKALEKRILVLVHGGAYKNFPRGNQDLVLCLLEKSKEKFYEYMFTAESLDEETKDHIYNSVVDNE